jgi:cell division protein FtsL
MAAVSNEPRRAGQARKAVVMLAAVITLVAVFAVFFSGRAASELQESRKRVDTLRAEIRRLESENARLRGEIDSVRKSTYAVERIAREDLGMSKKGEIVYLLAK